jgi:hypothetical protein
MEEREWSTGTVVVVGGDGAQREAAAARLAKQLALRR